MRRDCLYVVKLSLEWDFFHRRSAALEACLSFLVRLLCQGCLLIFRALLCVRGATVSSAVLIVVLYRVVAASGSWREQMLESGKRESESKRKSRCLRFLRGCVSVWTRGVVVETSEENVSRLWSDRGRGELERLDREQRRVKIRSKV